MIQTSEIDFAAIERIPGNIFHVTVKSGAEITLESAKRLIDVTNSLLETNNHLRGGVYDISKIAYIHADAREYLLHTSDIKGTVAGVALISNTYLGKILGNLFISLGSPQKFPVRYFESPMSAEHWVRGKMEEVKRKEETLIQRVA